MKILYVAHGHFWGSTWPYAYIDDYIFRTLNSMGHTVRIYNIFSQAEIVNPFLSSFSKQKGLSETQHIKLLDELAAQGLPLEVIDFEPDLVLHIVGRLRERVLKILRKLKAKTAIWYLDDPQEIDFTSESAPLYDYVFTVESAVLPVYEEKGSSSVAFLPLGCLPEIHKKQEVEEKYKSDICFVGVPFPARVDFFDGLADFFKGFKIRIIGGGPMVGGGAQDPWLWKRKLKRMDVYQGAILDEMIHPQEAAKYYNGAKINLNIHRAAVDQRFTKGNSRHIMPTAVSGRTFEIAGCGAFQLIDDKRSDVFKHFEVGKEMVTFSDAEDFKKKIEYYLSHEKERKAIAEAAQKKAYALHTYELRLKQIIEGSRLA